MRKTILALSLMLFGATALADVTVKDSWVRGTTPAMKATGICGSDLHPYRRPSRFVFNRSLLGLVACAIGAGFAGGLAIGLLSCRSTRPPDGR